MRIPVDIPFYATLLDTISATRNLQTLLKTHARIINLGLSHHDFLRSKLCSSYARCSHLHYAHLILSRANCRPLFLFNSLIHSYNSLRHFSTSLFLFRQLLTHGPHPDPRTLASALKSCAGLASLRLGHVVHATALISGLASDPLVSNSLVSMYSKCGDLLSARHVFDRMPIKNIVSYTAMISACRAHGRSEEAVAFFEEMVEEAPPDAAAMTAVLAACGAQGGIVGVGRGLFRLMREGRFGNVRPGVEHYTCMVDMLGRAGHVEEAERLIGEMDVAPDEVLLGALLGACRVHGRLDVAERAAERVYGGSRWVGVGSVELS